VSDRASGAVAQYRLLKVGINEDTAILAKRSSSG
jgi:hypothetical protein